MNALLVLGLTNAVMATGLALVAGLVGLVWRRPALAHALWLLVLLKLVTPPVIQVPIPWPVQPAMAMEAPAPPPKAEQIELVLVFPGEELVPGVEMPEIIPLEVEPLPVPAPVAQAPPEDAAPAAGWSAVPILAAAWLAGSLVWLTVLALRVARFRRLLRFARPAPAELVRQTRELAERLGLTCCPEVCLVPGTVSPMLWALGTRPRLLWPAGLLERLDAEQRATLLAHELAHLRRRDHWVRALELLATGLYWWNPVAWWACRQVRAAEEECCDAWVVWALPRAVRAYALALVETVDFLSESRPALPPVASGVGQMHDLKRRLTMIMSATTARRLGWGGFLAALTVGGLLLPLLPTVAQEPPAKPAERKGDAAEKQRQEARDQLERALDQVRKALELQERDRDGARKAIEDKVRAIQSGQFHLRFDDQNEAVPKDPAKAAAIDKARAEFKKVQAEAEEARARSREADERLRKAQEHLAQLEGRPGVGAHITIIIRDADGKVREIPLPPDGADFLKRFEIKVPPGAVKFTAPLPPLPPMPPLKGPPPVPGTPATPKPGAPQGDRRLEELEKKVDTLIREIESLRKDKKSP